MRNIKLVVEGIFAFIISYLSIFAALIVLPSSLGFAINLFAGNLQNAGILFSVIVCAAVLSSSFIIKHLRSLNIIPAK
ncbi:hypothetical protein AWH56_022875 [Anaerobacillus isosaccharinicus]|uniref:Uncharacterized protein n=1 Tax=Anaerobacillus isosaccharinicus TaxID=1532552 RepID=A0A1S2L4Y1_9BACI|nr:hypothetical protein [Anaerobacillus isosaccharinicus]MBA5586252.1 hypothetical protein [Anaerobacillus isosaccharinicus]QOY35496.1 hypothetical protein AWH56_022875 [Anaerobacillus isosaccharinicus]